MCPQDPQRSRLPPWLKKKAVSGREIRSVKTALRRSKLSTVCEEARCPNIGDCFSCGTATFMILGNVCTRSCGFCAVTHGNPEPSDPGEPSRVALQVKDMGISHAVVTSVTRDDLPDGGALHFARTIEAIRKVNPSATIEVLTPDFRGREKNIETVCDAAPDIFNHNIETVERLAPQVRNKASYRRSLDVLKFARKHCELTKSGLMVGLGETKDEVEKTISDLKEAGCEILTIGQYLRPSKTALPVKEYLEPAVFQYYKEAGLKCGFKHVFSGPFVRSSYHAKACLSLPTGRQAAGREVVWKKI